jgi:LacI family transcriptional regulator
MSADHGESPYSGNALARTVTRSDVARRAGVSVAVVSYVLNDGPRPVSPQTRRRVKDAIDELGYRPNGIARALRMQRTHTIGLVLPDVSNPFFADLARQVEDVASDRGYSLLLGNTSNLRDREVKQIHALMARQVDGLLLISSYALGSMPGIDDARIPVVLLDRVDPNASMPSVMVDNDAAAYDGVRHLLDHGHRRIACIAGPADLPASSARAAGWRRALADAGVDAPSLIRHTDFSRLGGYHTMQSLLDLEPRMTAVFACSDLQGVGALRACAERGAAVPGDVAVLSFDGTTEAEFTSPPLSVIRQPLDEIAARAFEALERGIAHAPAMHSVVAHTFVPRASCGCVPEDPR